MPIYENVVAILIGKIAEDAAKKLYEKAKEWMEKRTKEQNIDIDRTLKFLECIKSGQNTADCKHSSVECICRFEL